MKLSTKVVSEVLSYSDNISLKNHCKMILESYLYYEPNLTEQELRSALVDYVQGLE